MGPIGFSGLVSPLLTHNFIYSVLLARVVSSVNGI